MVWGFAAVILMTCCKGALDQLCLKHLAWCADAVDALLREL
jgi:hypothetical protein